jgi:ankyrin repeat protein
VLFLINALFTSQNKLLTFNLVDNVLPFHWACTNGEVAIVSQLLSDKVDLDTAISAAAANGHTAILELLWREVSGIPNLNWQHALDWAAREGHVSTCKFLLGTINAEPNNSLFFNAASHDQAAVCSSCIILWACL